MQIEMLKAKIHRATVTQAELNYVGSITIDSDLLEASAGKARSLSLDLYDQWKTMEVDGKWRFTSPTHVVLAFAQAMKELEEYNHEEN